MLEDMETGVAAARKGWIQKENVINTWTKDELMKFLTRHHT
jgi:DNA polymerase (family 10)